MAVKEKLSESSVDEIEWNVENEIQLFFAMNGHKPVGVNKYFHMVCIWEKFRAAIHKNIPLKLIWDHLESMYDLMALDEMEDLPFPSHESEFSLPEQDFSETMRSRKKEELDAAKGKEQREKHKEVRKEKDLKDTPKKEITLREVKGGKDIERKKDEARRFSKEVVDLKKDKKEQKFSKSRSKPKDDDVEEDTATNGKKERKDSESSRESLKRAPKRPTRQSLDSSAKATSSPRNTPPPKRRRI